MSSAPFILVDGSAYLFRAYHALPPLTNSKGLPTGAIYGVVNMLRGLIKTYNPEFMAVVFDAREKTFREEIYAEYKAHRGEMDEELACQIAPLHAVIKAMGLPLLVYPGYEADDVIGTLCKRATDAGWQTVVSTGDKDLAQLVNSKVTLVDTMRNTTLDEKSVEEKFGVPPRRIAELLALTGDTSDNIPGVPKVGPKTAAKWLQLYKDLDNLIKNADKITGKVGENLRGFIKNIPLSLKLTTIHCDVPIKEAIKTLTCKPANNQLLKEYFTELEFKRWLQDAKENTTNKAPENKTDFNKAPLLDKKDFESFLEDIKKSAYFAIDTETTGLDAMQADCVGISIATDTAAWYIPFAHDYDGVPQQLSFDMIKEKLQPFVTDKNKLKIGQNLKYDIKILEKIGLHLSPPYFDTMLASYVINSTATRHDMDSLALYYLNHQAIAFEEVAGKGAKQKKFNEVTLEKAAPYAAEDAYITLELYKVLQSKLKEENKLNNVFKTIETPLMPILTQMEKTGILLDDKLLHQQSKSLAKKIKILSDKAYKMAGEVFNLDSPKQLQVILYEKLKLPVLSKTPKGQPSTAESVLQDLSYEYELPGVILEYRGLSKLKNTYTDKLPLCINPTTKRVHTSFQQAVTATGRLSSSDPNLQNIPIKNADGRAIRQAFVAPKGYLILSADYSQIELRIMAHLSGDQSLIAAFQAEKDIHKATAAEVFGVSLDKVTSDQRRHAKAINFGLMYGMSAFGLAKQLAIAREDAAAYIDIYFNRYPGVKSYMQTMQKLAAKQGFVETFFGRRLYIPEIKASNPIRRKQAERIAINAPMQGTAADLIKLAMIKVNDVIKTLNAKMLLQVHDELVFEVQENSVEKIRPIITDAMTHVAKFHVPLKVAVGVGKNWDEAH